MKGGGLKASDGPFWTDEDGDFYYYEGAFLDVETMREKARAFEKECGCLDDEREERIAHEFNTIRHEWVLWPDDEDAPGEAVPEGTEGAVMVTSLH